MANRVHTSTNPWTYTYSGTRKEYLFLAKIRQRSSRTVGWRFDTVVVDTQSRFAVAKGKSLAFHQLKPAYTRRRIGGSLGFDRRRIVGDKHQVFQVPHGREGYLLLSDFLNSWYHVVLGLIPQAWLATQLCTSDALCDLIFPRIPKYSKPLTQALQSLFPAATLHELPTPSYVTLHDVWMVRESVRVERSLFFANRPSTTWISKPAMAEFRKFVRSRCVALNKDFRTSTADGEKVGSYRQELQIFLLRADERLMSLDEQLRFAQSKSLQVVDLEKLSFLDQVHIAMNASEIWGPSGAALTIGLFAESCASVNVLVPTRKHDREAFDFIAEVSGARVNSIPLDRLKH